MKFWDSSAIVPLLVDQVSTKKQKNLLSKDHAQVASWTTHCECYSALCRLEREGGLVARTFNQAHKRLISLAKSWYIVLPKQDLLDETKRVLRIHNLRCADAFQLAAAILASNKTPPSLEFVTLDERLALAASKEGFLLT